MIEYDFHFFNKEHPTFKFTVYYSTNKLNDTHSNQGECKSDFYYMTSLSLKFGCWFQLISWGGVYIKVYLCVVVCIIFVWHPSFHLEYLKDFTTYISTFTHSHSYSHTEDAVSVPGWGSVSFSRTLWHADRTSRRSTHRIYHWNGCSTIWTIAAMDGIFSPHLTHGSSHLRNSEKSRIFSFNVPCSTSLYPVGIFFNPIQTNYKHTALIWRALRAQWWELISDFRLPAWLWEVVLSWGHRDKRSIPTRKLIRTHTAPRTHRGKVCIAHIGP